MERPPPSTSLPPEIVTEILSRLPDYRTLTQCKSVCKGWRSIIFHPSFARTRSRRLSTWRLGKILKWGWGLPPLNITLTTYDSAANRSELHLNLGRRYFRPCLAGSCNGILYIQNPNSDAILLNPAMRSSTRIPPHGIQVSTAIATGLGYDHTTDDYKALVIINNIFDVDIRIFSLRNKLWKSISKDELAECIFRDYNGMTRAYDDKSHSCGTTIDGSPYWTGRRGDGMPVLIRFDMVREEFVDVGLPGELLVRPDEKSFAVGELEGMVCVTFKGENGSLEGWSKKKLDEDESWFKLFSFSPNILFERMKPLGGNLRGLGEVLMMVDKKVSLTKFNINDNSRQVIWVFCSMESYVHYIDTPYCPWELIVTK